MDNKKKIGKPDRNLVSGLEAYEVDYLAKKKKVSKAQVREAIRQVGHSRPAVEAVLDALAKKKRK